MSRAEDDRQRAVSILIPSLATCPPGRRLSYSDLVLTLAKNDLVIGTHTMSSVVDHLIGSGHLARLSKRSLMVPDAPTKKSDRTDPFAFKPDVVLVEDLAEFTSNHLRELNQRLISLENRLL